MPYEILKLLYSGFARIRSIALVALLTVQLNMIRVSGDYSGELPRARYGRSTHKLTNAAFLGGRKLICSISVLCRRRGKHDCSTDDRIRKHTSKLAKVLPQLCLVELFEIVDRSDIDVPRSSRSDVGHDGWTEIAHGSTPADLDLGVVNHQSMAGCLLVKAGSRVGIRKGNELTIKDDLVSRNRLSASDQKLLTA